MHIVFVQTGDYREAINRFAGGEPESYSDQRNSVEFVAELVNQQIQVTVISTRSEPYDEVLENGVRTIGLQEYGPNGQKLLANLVGSLGATHLVLRMPNPKLLRLGLNLGMDILPIFADSFTMDTFRQRYILRKLARLLNDPKIKIVSNHNMSASTSLAEIGVHTSKIVPYDFPRKHTPAHFKPKASPASPDLLRMVYVGVISEPKGVFDILNALPMLARMGINTSLSVVGDHKGMLDQAINDLGVKHRVELLGRQPNTRVVKLMREHDAVVVPSQHVYPEGLPHTIFEAIATRTPLIASDHPMFTPILTDNESCVMFPASNPEALAQAAQRLINEPGLYHRISLESENVWDKLMMPLVWHEIVELWLSSKPADAMRLRECSLAETAASTT